MPHRNKFFTGCILLQVLTLVAAKGLVRPNVIVMQPDDLVFFDKWGPAPNNPSEPDREVNFPNSGLPNMELLRTNGLQMMQAYAVAPMCGTSRYSTITGRYPSRAASSRLANNGTGDDVGRVTIPSTKLEDIGELKDCSEDNLAATLQNNGYRTKMVGKWHLSWIDDEEYTYSGGVDTVKGCGFDDAGGVYFENLSGTGFHDGSFSHNQEWITIEAVNFISETDPKPFFLYFNPTVPHGSGDVREALTNFTCRDVANGTLASDPMIEGMTLEYGNCEKYRQTVIARAETDADLGPIWVDDSIGALLKTLKKKGQLDNTIFLFQNDHGMESKGAVYENGIRISQFVHYPNGIAPGTTFEGAVATIDIAPTLLDYTGIDPPYTMDGTSWKNAWTDPEKEAYFENERCLFFEQQKDRATRCGCGKFLKIHTLKKKASKTYQKGLQYDYSVDQENLFDLCGGTSSYITDPTTNMEETNVASSDPIMFSALSSALQCHLTKTDYRLDPDYSTVCRTGLTSVPSTSPTSPPSVTGGEEGKYNKFALRKKPDGSILRKSCFWLSGKSDELKKKFCQVKKYQLYADGYLPASRVCFQTCAPYCVQQALAAKFIFKIQTDPKTGEEVEILHQCRWLQRKSPAEINAICNSTFDSDTGYGPASEVCTTICPESPNTCNIK